MARQNEKQRIIRQAQAEAMKLANSNNWEKAVEVNQHILQLEEDPQTYNRLGKAYLELGQYEEALDAYQQTLRLNPTNTIARRNLSRLESLISRGTAQIHLERTNREHVDLRVFITEAGKTMLTTLIDVPRSTAVDVLATGEKVDLHVEGNHILVMDADANILGRVEPKIGQRLSQLITGGNRYIAAIVQADPRQVRILIREIFQDPSQRDRTSFPGRLVDSGMYEYLTTRYDYEAEELLEDEDSPVDTEVLQDDFVGRDSEDEIGLEEIEKNINDDEEEIEE